MKRRVVVTGVGAVSPIGNCVIEMWRNARNGVCGIDFIDSFDTSNHKVKVAGEVKGFNPEDIMDKMQARRTARFVQLALAAAHEAFSQSRLDIKREDPARCGVNISSGIGGLGVIEEEHSKGLRRGFDKVSPLFVPMSITNMAAGMAAIEFGFRGSCQCIVTACASATNAVGEALQTSQRRISGRDDDRRKRKLYIRAWDRRIHFHEGSLRVKHTGQGFHTFR